METYATYLYIEQALYQLENIVQFDTENERQFGKRLQEVDRSFGGGVCDEKNLIHYVVVFGQTRLLKVQNPKIFWYDKIRVE